MTPLRGIVIEPQDGRTARVVLMVHGERGFALLLVDAAGVDDAERALLTYVESL